MTLKITTINHYYRDIISQFKINQKYKSLQIIYLNNWHTLCYYKIANAQTNKIRRIVMSMVRYNSYSPISSLKLLGDLDFRKLANLDDLFLSTFSDYNKPAIDIIEEKDSYIAKADVPGFTKENIDISVENNILTIKGEQKEEKSDNKNYIRKERKYSSFSKSIQLEKDIDSNNIKASMKNGILELILPKKIKKNEIKKITIN